MSVTDSRLNMWRTLFAVAHADNIVTDEELEFMAHVLNDVDFTSEQTKTLKDDILHPKDVEEMFRGVTDEEDRSNFFNFARDLVWVDGDFGSEEQSVMIKLQQMHYKDVKLDDLIGNVELELEDEDRPANMNVQVQQNESGVISALSSFKRWFKGE